MCPTDLFNRAYAKLPDLKPGDILEADDGFTCIVPGSKLPVKQDKTSGELYVQCCGPRGYPGSDCFEPSEPEETAEHYLNGQADDGIHLIGFYLSSETPSCSPPTALT